MQQQAEIEDDEQQNISCACEGCEKEVTAVCAGCGVASYCDEMHALEDWKNHAADCAYCINSIVGGSHWAVEMEVGQTAGDAEEQWVSERVSLFFVTDTRKKVPAELMHARLAKSGLIESTIANVDLVGKLATFESGNVFVTVPGQTHVPRGKIVRSNDMVTFRVIAANRAYKKVADFEYKISGASASRGVVRGRGMAFVLPEGVLKVRRHSLSIQCSPGGFKGLARDNAANLELFEESGQVYVQIGYRGHFWSIYGSFTITPSRSYAALRGIATFRLKARDENGLTAALIFHRSSAFKSVATEFQKYTLRELQVYIPEGRGSLSVFSLTHTDTQETMAWRPT
jgi:MYND finger protein